METTYTLADSATVLDCGHAPSLHAAFTTGWGSDASGRRYCYDCCAERTRADMIKTGRATLYLVIDSVTNDTASQTITRGWRVQDWPGHLRFPALYVRTGKHNMARTRRDFEFRGPDGYIWTGTQYGANNDVAHCKRTKRTH